MIIVGVSVVVAVKRLVVVSKVVVAVVVIRPAAVVLVVVVGSGRSAAIRPAYLYPLAQTKYKLSFILAGMRAQVSILKKCNQTLRSSSVDKVGVDVYVVLCTTYSVQTQRSV